MKTKPSAPFLIGAIAAVLLIIGSVVLVILGFGKLKTTERELRLKRKRLASFYRLEPYPSKGNVVREARSQLNLESWFSNLVSEASAKQLEPRERSPSRFMELLGQTRRKLLADADAEAVEVPQEFHFGFQRYFTEGSQLPSPDHVPRLTQQLVVIDHLCRAMYAEKVSRILTVTRQEFEGAGAGSRPRRLRQGAVDANVGIIGEEDLYAKLRFVVTFESDEHAVVGILNRLASHELFIVPTKLEFSKVGEDVRQHQKERESEDAGQAGKATVKLSRVERIVCGLPLEAPVSVKLSVDVYRFRKGPGA